MKLRKIVILIFVIFHLVTIFSQGFWSTFDKYMDVYHDEQFSIPYLNWTRPTQIVPMYYTLTGTDTGYGFYGIKASTHKYLQVTFFNDQGEVIDKDRTHGFETRNGLARFEGYASHLANYIADTDYLQKEAVTDTAFVRLVEFRNNYAEKSFKWVGFNKAQKLKECASYNVELYSIVPNDIWSDNKNNKKPKINVVHKYDFPVLEASK